MSRVALLRKIEPFTEVFETGKNLIMERALPSSFTSRPPLNSMEEKPRLTFPLISPSEIRMVDPETATSPPVATNFPDFKIFNSEIAKADECFVFEYPDCRRRDPRLLTVRLPVITLKMECALKICSPTVDTV